MYRKTIYPPFQIRVNPTLLKKIRYIAGENGRSANKEIEQLILKYVREYEKENGVITEDLIAIFLDSRTKK